MEQDKKNDIKNFETSEKVLEMANGFKPGNSKSEKKVLESIKGEIDKLEQIKDNDNNILEKNENNISQNLDKLKNSIKVTLKKMADHRNEKVKNGYFFGLIKCKSNLLKALIDNEIYNTTTREINLKNFKKTKGLTLGKSVVSTDTWGKIKQGLDLESEFNEKFKEISKDIIEKITESSEVEAWSQQGVDKYKKDMELYTKLGHTNSLKQLLENCGIKKFSTGSGNLDLNDNYDREVLDGTVAQFNNNFDTIVKDIVKKDYSKSKIGVEETEQNLIKLAVLKRCIDFAKAKNVKNEKYVKLMDEKASKLKNADDKLYKEIPKTIISGMKHLSKEVLKKLLRELLGMNEEFVNLPTLETIMDYAHDNYSEALEDIPSVGHVYDYLKYAFSDAYEGLINLVKEKSGKKNKKKN